MARTELDAHQPLGVGNENQEKLSFDSCHILAFGDLCRARNMHRVGHRPEPVCWHGLRVLVSGAQDDQGWLEKGREMSGIEKQTATVYYAPTRGRRYFRLANAARAEAGAVILKKHPVETYLDVSDGDCGFDIRYDNPVYYDRMHRKLSYLFKAAFLKSEAKK
jgi:hypothetical protein